MKGVIFTSFLSWVESTRGLSVTHTLLLQTEAALSTRGAYTAVGNYPSAEFTDLVETLARMEGTPTDEVMRDFGVAAFSQFGSLHPAWIETMPDLYSLLSQIESMIHTEVRKLYADSRPPLINAWREEDGSITVTYSSHRGLVSLCQGLIQGAARHYDNDCDVSVVSVRHEGDMTHATLHVTALGHG
jgi:hypothetical protein